MRHLPISWGSIPIAYVDSAIRAAEELGHDARPLLSRYGLTEKALLEPGKRVSHEQYYSIIEHLITDFNLPQIGLLQLQREKIADYGLVGAAAMSSDSLGEAIETLVRFQSLTSTPAELILERGSVEAMLVIGVVYYSNAANNTWQTQWAIDSAVAGLVVLTRHFLNGLSPYSQINLTCDPPEYAALYDEILGCPVHFNQPRNEARCSLDWFKTPLPTANKMIKSFSVRHCDAVINKLSQQDQLVEQVEGIILSAVSGIPSLQVVAESLNMSDRTLQRRLAQHNTSYRKLVNETRHRLAQQFLEDTELSIKEVSYLLHYTEPNNFSIAFKAIEGCSPQQYRNRLSGKPLVF